MNKRPLTAYLLSISLGLVVLLSAVIQPLRASAQAGGAVVVTNPIIIGEDLSDRSEKVIEETVEKPFRIAFLQILWNYLTFVSNRIAYDAAVSLATAGSGETPLIELRSTDTYLADLRNDIAGEAVAALSDTLEEVNIHFDLCAPEEPFRLAFQLGIRNAFDRPEPRCEFQEFTSNWEGFIAESFGSDEPNEYVLSRFIQATNPRTTDLTVGITLYSELFEDIEQEQTVGFAEFLANNGYKNVADAITGQTETPANLIQQQWEDAVRMSQELGDPTFAYEVFISNKELWKQLGLSAFSTFSNTLLSTFTDRIWTGLFQIDLLENDPFDTDYLDAGTGFSSAESAEDYFRSVFTVNPVSFDNYSVISEFTTCPGTTTRQLNNCVMDSNFGTALARADSGEPYTVVEAMGEGFLNGNWPLIAPDDARNSDDSCYTYGYCYSNLVRLRKARIIPVGWEIAAELQGSTSDTLQDVIDAFDDCNDDGERDAAHPYCHLIDPNWVLKYPSTQCEAAVPGQLVSDDGQTRGSECVDAPSCIREDASGQCIGGYGYCVREENTFNFRGDYCPEQYATCLSFDSANGTDSGSWLYNTLDQGECSENNDGCLWYATTQEEGDAGFDWPVIDDLEADEAEADVYNERLYVNNNIESCGESDAGCRQLIEKTDDVTLNHVRNPSFEDDADEDGEPDFWTVTDDFTDSDYADSGDLAAFGDRSILIGETSFEALGQRDIPIQQSQFYTLSFYAAESTAGSGSLTAYLIMDSESGAEEPDLTGLSLSGDCSAISFVGGSELETLQMAVDVDSEDYERFSCTFTTPSLSDTSEGLTIYQLIFNGTNVYLDGIQLEGDEDLDTYRAAYGTTLNSLDLAYYQVPPAYLGCTGSDDDPDQCDNYAPMCTAQNAGCELYTPENGDPAVSGIVSSADTCPAECVGYDTFKQEPTQYEPDGEFPVYFIPDTATSCNAQYVGCDEFTNLNTEAQEYYTYLRACLAEDQTSDEATYYTWEGSDLEGFQLRSWTLLQSDVDNGPCANWSTTEDSIICADEDDDSDGEVDTVSSCDEHDDIFSNPDCREFYDELGTIHYRLYSETVSITNDCNPYRKSDVAGDDTEDKQDTCEAASGYWDELSSECLFYGYPEESIECPESANGCREYTGGAGRNSSIIYSDDFEDEDINEYFTLSDSAAISNESIATDGHSVRVESAGGFLAIGYASAVDHCSEDDGCDLNSDDTCAESDGCIVERGSYGFTCTVEEGEAGCGDLVDVLSDDKLYTVSFWAKSESGTGSLTTEFIASGGEDDAEEIGEVDLEAGWQEFTTGPFIASELADFGASTILTFSSSSGITFFVDNITVREAEEEITVIKDSWETPASCDQTEEGADFPQYHLGCAAYTDSNNETVNLKSFTRLCDENQVGCTAFYDTAASDSPYETVHQMRCEFDANEDGEPDAISSTTTCQLGGETLCTIAAGDDHCLFDWDGAIPRESDGDLIELDDIEFDASELTDPTLTPTLQVILGSETQVASADELIYLVASSAFACSEGAMGCMEVGLPTYGQDHSLVESWETTYIINNPDTYSDTLCAHDELFCEAWDSTQDGTFYFKNPAAQQCEYLADISIDGTEYSGWFREGTNEFCYGSGFCTDDETISCLTDSDCAIADAGSCDISEGSYLVSGTMSDIWRNGDTNYEGWAGVCEDQYDLCTEFVDPLEVGADGVYASDAGQAYHYVNNDELDESNLSASRRCNGQVSQSQGCVLFENTLNAEMSYNASASYVLSVHADLFYAGADSTDLVDPISCPSGELETLEGEVVDFCANRCVYQTELLDPYSDISASEASDYYTFTTSCLSNNDCAPIESESGELVDGQCVSESFSGAYDVDGDGTDDTVEVPELENDTNDIKKVNLDRACSEWLACRSTTTVWNSNTGEFETVCEDIGLCNEYSTLGESSFCANWNIDQSAHLVTSERYAARETGWYGNDYSGYTIPFTIPAHQLSQVNVAPAKWCVSSSSGAVYSTDEFEFVDCSDDESICNSIGPYTCETADSEYRLVYEGGSCEVEEAAVTSTISAPLHGEDCTVGFCEESGLSCASDSDCGSGDECQTGYCAFRPSSLPLSCVTDNDCGTGYSSCVDGLCHALTSEACSEASECGSRSGVTTCVQAAQTFTGSCFNNRCLVDFDDEDQDGNPDKLDYANSVGSECRAWPESSAPFPNSVVSDWYDIVDRGASASDDVSDYAFTTLSTFSDVNLCANGDECACEYEKVEYGSFVRYEDPGSHVTAVCVGGSYEGAKCNPGSGEIYSEEDATTAESTTCTDGGGTCTYQTAESSLIGLEGFCLEYDTVLTVDGESDKHPCLTWLPVDRVSGATDLYGKYLTAGFQGGETYYCAELTTMYDLRTTNKNATELILLGVDDICPRGYFGIEYTDGDGVIDNFCVPKYSYNGDGDQCSIPGTGAASAFSATEVDEGSISDTYIMATESAFESAYSFYYGGGGEDSCTTRGLDFETMQEFMDPFGSISGQNQASSSSTDAFDNEAYLGCASLVLVSDDYEEGYNKAWTDRIWELGNYEIDSDLANYFEYDAETEEYPFGEAVNPFRVSETDLYPHRVLSCEETAGPYLVEPQTVLESSGSVCTATATSYSTYELSAQPYLFGYFEEPNDSLAQWRRWLDLDDTPTSGWSYAFDHPFNTDASWCEEGDCDCDTYASDPKSQCNVGITCGSDGYCEDGPRKNQSCGEDGDCQVVECLREIDSGSTNRCMYPASIPIVDEDPSDAVSRIEQIFAGVLNFFEWGSGDELDADTEPEDVFSGEEADFVGGYELYDEEREDVWDWDVTVGGDGREAPQPPVVRGLGGGCTDDACKEAADNTFSVNGSTDGEIAGLGQALAVLKFYVEADADQLPIRRIVIDWQDGSALTGSVEDDNFYQNHRGLKEGGEPYCNDETAGDFGESELACDSTPIQANHYYTCSESRVSSLIADGATCVDSDGDGLPDVSPCVQDDACVFRPRVHVRDNWGWCTGVCPDASTGVDGTSGCYDGDDDGIYEVGLNDECNISSSFAEDDPWTYYGGVIVVEP